MANWSFGETFCGWMMARDSRPAGSSVAESSILTIVKDCSSSLMTICDGWGWRRIIIIICISCGLVPWSGRLVRRPSLGLLICWTL